MNAKQINRFIVQFGIDIRVTLSAFRNIGRYLSDLKKFKKQIENRKLKIGMLFPCLHDKCANAGVAKGDYFHADLSVAQEIFKKNPSRHVDIGSSVSGFVAHVASFRKIEVFDIRDLSCENENIEFRKMDITKLGKRYENYADSLSCLSVLEHFGLGRYGDNLDIDGHKKGFENLSKILKKDGILYLAVPIGKRRVEFNAHRVFPVKEIIMLAKKNRLELIHFSYVDNKGSLQKNIKLNENKIKSDFNFDWGCGIFEFKKI